MKRKRSGYYEFMPEWTTKYSPPGGCYNYAYYLVHPWRLAEDWYYQAKWFVQRGWRGYSDSDVWSLDWYLARWLPKALRWLRDQKYGRPCNMTIKGWSSRLEKMADGFDAAFEIQDIKHEHRSVEERAAWRRFNSGMRLFHEHFFNLWD